MSKQAHEEFGWDEEQEREYDDSRGTKFSVEKKGQFRIRIFTKPFKYKGHFFKTSGGQPFYTVCSQEDDCLLCRKDISRSTKYGVVIIVLGFRASSKKQWQRVKEDNIQFWGIGHDKLETLQDINSGLPKKNKGIRGADLVVSLKKDKEAVKYQKLRIAAITDEKTMLTKKLVAQAEEEADKIIADYTTPRTNEDIRKIATGEGDGAETFDPSKFDEDGDDDWNEGDDEDVEDDEGDDEEEDEDEDDDVNELLDEELEEDEDED